MTWTPGMPDRRQSSDLVSWKAYVDRVLEEQKVQRESEAQSTLDRIKSLHEHVSTVANEKQLASEKAERERDRAAMILAEAMQSSIEAGDTHLQQHIAQEILRVSTIFDSVEKRIDVFHKEMILRDSSVRDLLLQTSNSNDLRVREAFHSSEKAIEKAEAASEKRFDSVNEFREQLGEQAGTFLLREVADAQFLELRKLISANTDRLNTSQGHTQGSQASIAQIMLFVGAVISIAAILVGAYT